MPRAIGGRDPVPAQSELDPHVYSSKTPEDILPLALESFDNAPISFSRAEDVAVVDMASRIRSDIRMFSLDSLGPMDTTVGG